ncbi:MAG TPA: hypothetical protein DEQ45_05030 [Agrobacterium sp.]|jgi:hypothetical protein|uniref:hypothetical protein n=1 Tax=Rhizobium sp. TaxID=391 RepID=UPI000EDB423A|nr:hypothetical protein [Agrobacterium sp.]
MRKPHYLDPLGSRLPALERNLIRLRSMQMVLVLFYAEQVKQTVLNLVQTTDRFRVMSGRGVDRVPKNAKDQVKKCLKALVEDGLLSVDESEEIRHLIDYRNMVGHEIHELVADISTERAVRDRFDFAVTDGRAYNYEAVERLRHYLGLLHERQDSYHYVGTLCMDSLMFTSAERTLLADIKKAAQQDPQTRKEAQRRY